MQVEKSAGPLAGLRVIEMGSFIAGPFCAQILADMGAEVIKIETPGSGDPMRQWGVNLKDGKSVWWPVIGRNKKSVTLDLHTSEGQDIARRLIMAADILVENFRPGTLEQWNLGPEELRREHPALIVARVSGFGQTGPYRERAGFGSVAEAMGGLRTLAGFPDRMPPRVGISIGDSLAGLFAALGVMASLHARSASGTTGGRGQVVDVAITESVMAVLESVISEYSATGIKRSRTGSILPGIAPSNLYPTKDGDWVLIAANADGVFRRLAAAMERPDLAADPRYATHRARGVSQLELDEIIAEWSAGLPAATVVERLTAAGVPAGPVYDAAGVAQDPHFRDRGAVIDVETEDFGVLTMQGVVPHFSDTPGSVRWPGASLGQHNEEVYGELLGFSASDIARLRERGVL